MIEALIRQQGGKQWDEDDFADVSYFYKQFVLVKHDKLCETVAAFRWKDGKVVGLGIDGDLEEEKEYSYVHLQKRKMQYQNNVKENDYLITPDGFITYTEQWKQQALVWIAEPLKIYPQVLENVRVTDKKAAQNDPAVQEAVKAVAEALGDTGRILVRESGTEPVVRVMVEAPDHDTCQKYVSQVVEVIKAKGYAV